MNHIMVDDYKLVIIVASEHPILEEGTLVPYGKMQDDKRHALCVCEFLKEYYPDFPDLQKLADSKPELSIFCLQKLGNIIFTNLSSIEEIKKKTGKIGMVFMPDYYSMNQQISLENLMNQLEDYQIGIVYHSTYINDQLNDSYLHPMDDEKPIETLKRYYQLTSLDEKKKTKQRIL